MYLLFIVQSYLVQSILKDLSLTCWKQLKLVIKDGRWSSIKILQLQNSQPALGIEPTTIQPWPVNTAVFLDKDNLPVPHHGSGPLTMLVANQLARVSSGPCLGLEVKREEAYMASLTIPCYLGRLLPVLVFLRTALHPPYLELELEAAWRDA